MRDDGSARQRPGHRPGPDWLWQVGYLLTAVAVAALFRKELAGWPLAVVIMGIVLRDPLARLVDSFGEWVELKWGDKQMTRQRQELNEDIGKAEAALASRMSSPATEEDGSYVRSER